MKVGWNSLDLLLHPRDFERTSGYKVQSAHGTRHPKPWIMLGWLVLPILVYYLERHHLIGRHHSLSMLIKALQDLGLLYR